MGVQSNNTINTTMKTILLICAFAAFAAALPSDDIETDLLTPVNEVVPETIFVAEEATKPAHTSADKKSTKGLPQCADIYDDAPSQSTYTSGPKKGQKTLHKGLRTCLCIPNGKNAKWAKTEHGKKKFKNYKPCYGNTLTKAQLKKIPPSERKNDKCDGWGMAWAKNCAPPRPPKKKPKKCTCHINGGKGRFKGHTEVVSGPAAKHLDWSGKRFRGIECSGCEFVRIHDDDGKSSKQDIVMGKNGLSKKIANERSRRKMRKLGDHTENMNGHKENKSCCGKKTCKYDAPLAFWKKGYDLSDDVAKITIQGAC